MHRREFLAVLSSVGTWPLAARADNLPTIGFLGTNTPATGNLWVAAFVQRLRELNWIEGRTVAIETRWGDSRPSRLGEIATEFIERKVNVIVTYGTTGAVAAKQATSVIPVVFVLVSDPVGIGLVASLKRPGGNLTGLSNLSSDLGSKKLELLREVLPGFRRLAIMINVGNSGSKLEAAQVQAAAGILGLDTRIFEIQRAEDIAPTFDRFKGDVDAIYVPGDPLFSANRLSINGLAVAARLPTMHGFREQVEAGGLMSYGTSFTDLFRHAADYVDKILHGATPADMPVEQPTKFELLINLKTAKALGLEIPPQFLARVDDVIE
jgi:putative ABC transport system substrate-binding protein